MFGAGGAGTTCTGADNVKMDGIKTRVYDRFGVFLMFFSNVKIDCIKEMGKL